ncbi:bifunctional hydroxymethylpyrimidine kinase/phosphomethylpyrimidine kinase [Enterococcus hulanensis]|uniref:pyridoxal kinase n=1 Tax=Enterococcus hulanensis TaxID=2559929 RepID=A0ABU3EVU6_9ENTE|nr:bifunctional hydroxymethylpyrimidine kinase/phosphomethylpyrimidine kinase [Enterococcus hulanensis]MDT2598992.1 bifunctional hydroxymethylpyrimidine kinase/phosphomethylpyrimidine kinase [Enterococcus hulanensis]MDT2610643.1 bifunctional hydroxymethylpyrimidine kinase/phosphomethylpyrimidine kinase [Enterococcus hulanensis]MDT2614799.1 bifunctional hydroxymethylpyrimidine kinase/phosphomethylpyrimidine kinase [Enterococcus hulanensis]MDT2627231.1 bifunctional hydroxymethylpyrimidine kinase/
MKKVATIAGSDATGGGGLEADLKTFQEFGTFGLAAITSIVTLEPETGAHHLRTLSLELIQEQIASVFAGPIDSIKTGLLPTQEIIALVSEVIPKDIPLVVDPVIGGKGTQDFIKNEQVQALREKLLPHALITTPNLREAGILSELGELTSEKQMEQAAKKIASFGVKHVVIKGGTRLAAKQTLDLHYDGRNFTRYPHPIIDTPYNHGAGCTFAAAITAAIAKNYPLDQAIKLAIDFVQAAITMGEKINPYVGHVWHGAYTHGEKRLEYSDEQ